MCRGKIRNRTKKEVRAATSLSRNTMVKISKEPTCPYCGQKMVLRRSSEIFEKSIKEEELFVCKNYPDCDCYCRTRITKKGDRILASTPANAKLRRLRIEAHHYLRQITNNKILTTEAFYYRIGDKLSLGAAGDIHIGEMGESGCNATIQEAIHILYMNKNRLQRFSSFVGSMATYSQATKKELSVLCKVRRRLA